jgi:hypothetical protein
MNQEYSYTTTHPQRRKKWPWVVAISVAAVFALCGIGAAVLGVGGKAVVDAVETEAADRKADVKLTACSGTSVGTVDVKYTIVNSGTVERTYLLDVEVTDASGTRVGSANAIETDVKPGKTVKGTAVGVLEGKPSKFTCTLVEA